MTEQFSNENSDDLGLDVEEWIAVHCDEYVQLFRDGKAGTIEEFAAQYPELESGILDLLPTILLMEDARGRNLRKRKDGRVQIDRSELPDFADFKLGREIGRGGMGIVYEAHQVSLDRRVAIKVLPKSLLEESQISQFGREASMAAKLHHTNIAPIYGVGENCGTHFFAMQLLEGETLEALFNRREQFRANEVVSIGRQVASALQYAHDQGVFHRDIKPANLIQDSNNHVWVTDFGLAISRENQATEFGNSVSGTLRYMPPESLTESPNETKTIDSAVGDIYSLGITLVELLSGRPAFDQSGTLTLVDSIKVGNIGALHEKGNAIPKDLRAVIRKMVATAPGDRYQTAQEVVKDMENLEEGRSVNALPKSLVGDLWRWGKRNSTPAIIFFSGAVLLYAVSLISTIALSRLDGSLKAEQQQRVQAEDSARLASQAIDRIFNQFSYMSTFSDSQRLSTSPRPRVTQETALMLRELAGFYSRLATNNSTDSEISLKAVMAQCHVAEINETLGDYDTAADAFRGALVRFRQLESTGKSVDEHFIQLQTARIHNQLGKVFELKGESKASIGQHEKAIELLKKLDSIGGERRHDIALELAYSHYLNGHQSRPGMGPNSLPPEQLGRSRPGGRNIPSVNKVESEFQIALGILKELEREQGDNSKLRNDSIHLAALCYRELADDNWGRRSNEEQAYHNAAVEKLTELSKKFPAQFFYRHELMKTLAEIDVIHLKMKPEMLEQAYSSLEKAIGLGRELIVEQPDIVDYRIELAHAYFKLGAIAGARAEHSSDEVRDTLLKRKEEAYRMALSSQTFLSRQRPTSKAFKVWIARFALTLAECETMATKKKNRSKLIERAVTVLFALPKEYKSKPEVASIIAEAKALSTTTMFE